MGGRRGEARNKTTTNIGNDSVKDSTRPRITTTWMSMDDGS